MNEAIVSLEQEPDLTGYYSAKKAETLNRRCAEYISEIRRLNESNKRLKIMIDELLSVKEVGFYELTEQWVGRGKMIEELIKRSKSPRVMKRWTDDCKPEYPGMFWLRDLDGGIYVNYVSIHMIESYGVSLLTHWLELEPNPVLPVDQV
jgi:hypothetical protein